MIKRLMINRIAAAAGLLVATVTAQKQPWSIPERGAALYRRQLDVRDTVLEPASAAGRRLSVFNQAPAPAMVLHGELDPTRSFPDIPLYDLRDVAARVAFDLRLATKAGKLTLQLPHTWRQTATSLDLQLMPPDKDGTQTIRGVFAPNPKGRDPRLGGSQPEARGEIHLTRYLDAANRRVAGFDSRLVMDLVHTGDSAQTGYQKARVEIVEKWEWDRDLTSEEGEFRIRVIDGIRNGAGWLRRQLATQVQSRLAPPENGVLHVDAATGRLALMLLTLLKAGESATDPEIASALEELRSREIHDTYTLASAIMAIEAIYAPPAERDALIGGLLKAPMPRKPSAEDRKLLAEWTRRLLGNIDTSVDSAYRRRWHYHESRSFDNSNTQYAMLGLYAAMLCGVEISPQVWVASANHWLEVMQKATADAFPLSLETHAEAARTQRTTTVARGPKVAPGGWSYTTSGTPTGSMTCAGITGLTLCAAALRGRGKGARKQLDEMHAAIQSGFAWLASHLSVRGNPGDASSWTSWHYYYLYGLERSCELSQIARLQGRDWYFEGALLLLGQQKPDGSFLSASPEDTCFAVLFLKKVALPAITGR